jgi:hypothetical protein
VGQIDRRLDFIAGLAANAFATDLNCRTSLVLTAKGSLVDLTDVIRGMAECHHFIVDPVLHSHSLDASVGDPLKAGCRARRIASLNLDLDGITLEQPVA